jgi:hypothetical protein
MLGQACRTADELDRLERAVRALPSGGGGPGVHEACAYGGAGALAAQGANQYRRR